MGRLGLNRPVNGQSGKAIDCAGLFKHPGVKRGVVGEDQPGGYFAVDLLPAWGVFHDLICYAVQVGHFPRGSGLPV